MSGYRSVLISASLAVFASDAEAAPDPSRPVLGDDGPEMADRVIAKLTPGCPSFETAEQVQTWAAETRQRAIQAIGLDLNRRVKSAELQRVVQNPSYRIEVMRIEVFRGVYMPANVYVPEQAENDKLPLVVTPTGCGAATWDTRSQRRASNLARLGMVVIVTEGFCGNGMRANLPESRRHIGYARQMMGLENVAFSLYVQELVATISWALAYYPFVDSERISAAGYSYGGQVALLLAQLDTRVVSTSVSATYLGGPCDGFPLKSDIDLETNKPGHIWLAPLELPIMPTNWRLLTVFPRALQTISGAHDPSAPPNVIGGAMSYVREVYELANLEDRVSYVTDRGDHAYNARRRRDAYGWLAHTLLGAPLSCPRETQTPLRAWELLAVDISGSASFTEELRERVASRAQQLRRETPEQTRTRIAEEMSALFPAVPDEPRETMVYRHDRGGVTVTGYRMAGPFFSFPAVVFELPQQSHGKTVLYLPHRGTRHELPQILPLLQHYDRVISVDYLGVGELKSDRLRLHSLARHLMHNDPSLPQLNVQMIRSYVSSISGGTIDIWATSWATSFYAAAVRWLDSKRVGKIHLCGVPEAELKHVQSGRRIPDLLLWAGLFSRTTVRELASAIGEDAVLH